MSGVTHDWSAFNQAVDRSANPEPTKPTVPWRPMAIAGAAGLILGGLMAYWWLDPAVVEPLPPAEPPVMRIHPDDLAKLNIPPLRIDTGDLDRLAVKVAPVEGTIRIDPRDLARLEKAHTAPPPAIPQQIAASAGSSTAAGGRVVTNFSVFKTVKFKQGRVITEWRYDSSESSAPSGQYCAYDIAGSRGALVSQTLQTSKGGPIDFNPNNPPDLSRAEWTEATSLCEWHPGR